MSNVGVCFDDGSDFITHFFMNLRVFSEVVHNHSKILSRCVCASKKEGLKLIN